MYKFIIKPIFFLFQPEVAHNMSFYLLRATLRIPGMKFLFRSRFVVNDERLKRRVFGLDFPNPVGLAAGFDKDATLFNELACLGFGFVEIGTVTPKPQPGNDKPRLFRLPKDRALINRMGFNNHGVHAAAERLKRRKTGIVLGGNIGKNKNTPNEDAISDYVISMEALHPVVDYFVVNVSSPNTPNLRALQEKEPLKALLNELMLRNRTTGAPRPLLLKIAPDLTTEQLDDIIEIVMETGIDGVIATNTTIAREPLTTAAAEVQEIGAGGLSGLPVKEKSTEVIRYLHSKSNGAFPIIGVGGISNAEDAREKLDAGASLVQVYTSFIYEGPALASNINQGLLS
ncbi:MAG: quinone-dependent dihydroorotate dehydrogenase [Flavobacteriales bacterium]|jgi:dihydroorotate dehydrogenase|nr:quinone-dependent dihydroorotate dehydrogenase [Flavobacteriales bacterium]